MLGQVGLSERSESLLAQEASQVREGLAERVHETRRVHVPVDGHPVAGGELAGSAEAPVERNTNLGYYTNFVNLLDLCALAVPGTFRTDMVTKAYSEETLSARGAANPLGKIGDPDELVGPALLLASDAGSMITGAVLVVDAGATVAPSGRG